MNFQFLGVRPEAAWGTALLSQCRKFTKGKLGNKKMNAQAMAWFNANQSKLESSLTSNHPEEMLRNE